MVNSMFNKDINCKCIIYNLIVTMLSINKKQLSYILYYLNSNNEKIYIRVLESLYFLSQSNHVCKLMCEDSLNPLLKLLESEKREYKVLILNILTNYTAIPYSIYNNYIVAKILKNNQNFIFVLDKIARENDFLLCHIIFKIKNRMSISNLQS